MPRCVCCKRKNHLSMTCKWCAVDFCPSCITYERHACKKFADMKQGYHQENEKKLIQNRVTEVKVLKI